MNELIERRYATAHIQIIISCQEGILELQFI